MKENAKAFLVKYVLIFVVGSKVREEKRMSYIGGEKEEREGGRSECSSR